MKSVKTLLASALLLILAFSASGQATEHMALSGGDPLKAVRVYPNPAVEFVTLRFEQPVARQVVLELHSIIGNSLEIDSEVVDDHEIRIRTKDLPTGYYLLDVKLSGSPHTALKFLKR
jgi:hypothetical protein